MHGRRYSHASLLLALAAFALPSPSAAAAPPGEAVEKLLTSTPDRASYGRHLRLLTAEPHMTDTPRNNELAEYVRAKFIEYGLDEASFHDSPALLAYPRAAELEMLAPQRRNFVLKEAEYPEDEDSTLYRDPTQVPFHAYADSGEVSGEVVYANGGSPEDFAELDRLGIDVKGRIVLMRYSQPYSYRGYKLYQAEMRGAAGALIYSDPMEDGYFRGDTYPEGPWGPMSHVQWGGILYDWLGPGEPFTFHWTRDADGTWREGPRRDKQLPRIPSMPLSAENAQAILATLKGPVVPSGWQGALPLTYHLGPGPVKLRLKVDNEERIGNMRNVIGVIRGREEPDKWVILGNHRDAWSYGAVDPSGGTAALLETARALGAALKRGHRPRRTLVFASWDAEEHLLGGSTQWVKDHAAKLGADAVTYINVDSGVSGSEFGAGATPALARFLRDVSKAVDDPQSGESLHTVWSRRSPDGIAPVNTIVGATDYTAFQEHLGISCIDMRFGGPYGVYHSQYDNYYWMSRIGDPGFRYGETLSRLWSVMAWRLADAEVLPMRYGDYARAVIGYIEATEAHAAPRRVLRLEAARAAAARWEAAAQRLDARLDAGAVPEAGRKPLNQLLLEVERALTDPAGLAGRAFFRHLLVAPQPTYRSEFLPRVWEAVDRDDWDAVSRHEAEVAAAFDRAAALMHRGIELAGADLPSR